MHYEFQAPITLPSNVPFKNIKGLNEWLDNLTTLQSSEKCLEILSVLQVLKKNKIPNKAHLNALEKINIHLVHSVKHFDAQFWETKFPLQYDQFSKLETVVWVYAELSRNYQQLAETHCAKKGFLTSKRDLAFLIYQALQALSQVYLKISSCYAAPYPSFWVSLYQLYFLAEEHALLSTAIKIGGSGKKTVEQLFTTILLLNLSNTQQFRPRDLQQVFDFLEKYSHYAYFKTQLDSAETGRARYFSAHQELAPQVVTDMQQRVDQCRYFIFTETVKRIFAERLLTQSDAEALPAYNQSLFLRAYNSLAFNRTRRQTRIHKRRLGHGVIGIENIVAFHLKNTPNSDSRSEVKSENIDSSVTLSASVNESEFVDLVAEEDLPIQIQERPESITGHDIFAQENLTFTERRNSLRLEEFEILNSTFKGYQILWNSRSEKVQIGNVFGMAVYESERSIEVGLVRHMSAAENSLIIGVEILGFESQVVYAARLSSPQQKTPCLLLNGTSLLFSAKNFLPSDELYIFMNNEKLPCHLGELLYSTPSVTHCELFFGQ